jgi:hypothetical protein
MEAYLQLSSKMKYILSVLVFTLAFGFVQAQTLKSDILKMRKIIGMDFQELPPSEYYPFSDVCEGCSIVPSLNLQYDTTGIVNHNEFILFRHPLIYISSTELTKWIRLNHVTVKEYNQFQSYVRDSIARVKIILSDLCEDKTAYQFLNRNEQTKEAYFEKENFTLNRLNAVQMYHLNWDKKFSFFDPNYLPILADMYLPLPERYFKQKKFDERKFIYIYNEMLTTKDKVQYNRQKIIPTISNQYLWSTSSLNDRDIWSVHGQLYNQLFLDEKSIGLSGVQATAFCFWKQQQIQNDFNLHGLKYRVIVSLPINDELKTISENSEYYLLKSYDNTANWQITAEEYQCFIKNVQDSILTEKLYNQIPNLDDKTVLLDWTDIYFNEGNLEYDEFDPTKYGYNRLIFNLMPSKKMEKKYAELVNQIRVSSDYCNPKFTYYTNDARARSVVGNLTPMVELGKGQDSMSLELFERDSLGNFMGLEGNYPYKTDEGYTCGVRFHYDIKRFFHRKEVMVVPEQNLKPKNNELIQSLTYDQAVAFYYWKYPIQSAKEGDDWHQFVIPSKEQFEAIQKGETVIIPEQSVAYPSPVFRYVVHIFPMD